MDRFIDFNLGACTAVIFDLKSNMDRFIDFCGRNTKIIQKI